MRFLKGLFLALIVSVTFSCQTTGGAPEVSKDSGEKRSIKKPDDTVAYYKVSERAFYGDGQVDTIVNYSYNKDYLLVKKSVTNEQEEVLESTIYKYKGKTLVSSSNYGFGDELISYTKYKLDDNNNVIEEVLFNKEDKVQSSSSYVVEDGLRKEWKTMGPNGELLALSSFYYNDAGQIVKIEMKDAGGVIDGVIEKEYENGNIVKESVVDSKGKLEKSTEYKYDDDLLVEKIYYDKRGKKNRSESYEYNDGLIVPSKINYHFKNGSLETYTLLKYESYKKK